MSETYVNLYSVFCIAENKYVDVWGTTKPTLCPNDHADRSINPVLTKINQTISEKKIIVEEPSDGYFQTETIVIDIPSGTPGLVHSHDISWPVDILVWRTRWQTGSDNIGDTFNIIASPDKVVGTITQETTAGTNIIHVDHALTQEAIKGLELVLVNGGTTENLGRIITIDNTNDCLTMEKNAVNTFPTGSIIQLNLFVAINMRILHNDQKIRLGDKGFKGKQLPANTVLRINYTNNSGTAKQMDWQVEYYLNYE